MAFIAVQECAVGNESVGTEWLEARRFGAADTLSDVWAWRESLPSAGGRLMLLVENRKAVAE